MDSPLKFEFDDCNRPLRSSLPDLQLSSARKTHNARVSFTLSSARLDDVNRRPLHSRLFQNAEFGMESVHPMNALYRVERRFDEEGLPGPSGSEEQPAAPVGFMQPRLDFSVTYSMAANSSEGIVPAITVGNVYAMAREGAFTGDKYGPKMAAQDVKEYFAHFPQGAQMIIDNQRELAHKFGPPSVTFQDYVGVQEEKVAFWVSEKAALQACSLQNIFSPVTSSSLYTSTTGRLHDAADAARKQLDSTVRRNIPRLPIFLLPSRYWMPRRPAPSVSAENEATQQARDRLRRMGLPEEAVSKVHVHSGHSPHSSQERKSEGPQKGLPLALPLVHALNYLQDKPPWCCFASDPLQGKSGGTATGEQAQSRQGGTDTSSSASDSRKAAVRIEAALSAGSLPVFRIPGLSLVLPTTLGHVDFSPLFLSKEQLHATWSAIRGVQYRWVMGRRKSQRREVRQLCELVAARLAGVAPSPLPPQQGAQGSEDEEGMDEPPEVRDFLQELGEGGGRGSGGEDASSGALPTGPGAVLLSAAVGALSLGAHAAEWACDAADTLFSKTPAGRKALGLLSEPAVRVHALDRYVNAANAWNQKTLAHRAACSAPGDDSGQNMGSVSGSDNMASVGGSGESAFASAEAQKQTEVEGSGSGESQEAGSSSSNDRGCCGKDTACAGPSSEAAARHSALDEALDSSVPSAACTDTSPKELSKGHRSRVRALLSRLRRRSKKPAEQLEEYSGREGENGSPAGDLELPASAVPVQDSLDTVSAGTAALSTSESHPAALTSGSASCSDRNGDDGLDTKPQEAVDWGELNSSMMQALHVMISDLITAAIAKTLGMPGVGLEIRRAQSGREEGISAVEGQDNNLVSPEAGSQSGMQDKLRHPVPSAILARLASQAALQNAAMMHFNVGKAVGTLPDDMERKEGTLSGLLLIGDLHLDPHGRRLPWPMPPIGFGNAAHLADMTTRQD